MKFAELTQIALLGTERQAISVPALATALGQLESQIDTNQKERALLSLAVVSGLHERTGSLPARDDVSLPPVCPAEQQQRVSERAGSLLLRMLSGEFAELLPEWLVLATKGNLVAPPETLPALLGVGAERAELREIILPVLGERGRWLAAQNPEWAWVTGAAGEDENIWHVGERPARLMFLQRLRRTNAARARELVMQTGKEETPDDRAAFISAFEIGLASADESFLESGLDDKRKEVRRTAAMLLARLPDSALVRRAVDRVKPLLRIIPGEAGSVLKLKRAKPATIEVTLPSECNKEMTRDGVESKPPQGIGEKAWWLIQMLEPVPLDLWTRETSISIEEILAASQAGEWQKELFEAWTRAAVRQQNTAWAEALFEGALEDKRFDKFEGLLGVMPPARREERLAALLSQDDPKIRDLHGTLFSQCRHDWSPAFSRIVLGYLRQETRRETGDWQLRNQIKALAPRLAPGVLAESATGWPTESINWGFWSKGVDEFLAITQFRSDLRNTLTAK
jgi:hypothetical protein